MRMARALTVFLVFGATMLVQGATRTIDFSDDTVGQSPKGFEFGHTAKVGAPGRWVIQAEGANKYLVQTDADANRCAVPRGALQGPERHAHGPAGERGTLRVVATGPRFDVHFNGAKLYEVEDATFTQAGKVGVWTKADSVTQFDDFTVVTK